MSLFKKLNTKSLKLNILTILIIHISLVAINTKYVHNYNQLIQLFEIAFMLLFIPHIKILLKKENQLFNLVLALFCTSIIISSFLNRNFISSDLVKACRYSIGIFETFIYFEYIHSTGKVDQCLKVIYKVLFIYAALSDFLCIIKPDVFMPSINYVWHDGRYYNAGTGVNTFLVGNKFLLSYLHIFVFVLYYYFYEKLDARRAVKKNKVLLMHFIWAIVAAVYSECTTALLGCIVLGVIVFFGKKFYEKAHKTGFLLTSIAVCDSFFIYSTLLLGLKPIKYFVENILHETTDLTGRVYIYEQMVEMVMKKFWFGFGYENNYRACTDIMGYDNAQNGIFDNLVSYGFIGTVLLVVLLCLALKKSRMNQNAFVYLIYIYILLSSVETTMNLKFIVAIAFMAFAWNKPSRFKLSYIDSEGDYINANR